MSESLPGWAELVDRVRAGDSAAERALIEALHPKVAARISRLRPRRETLEDLTQEVFVRVFHKLDTWRGGSFPAWVDVIAKRVCYDALRKQRVRPEWTFTELGEDASQNLPAEEVYRQIDAREMVAQLLAKMPPEMAWLVRTVELKEQSIGDLSQEMGWTPTAGRLRLFRARQRLKTVFNEFENLQ